MHNQNKSDRYKVMSQAMNNDMNESDEASTEKPRKTSGKKNVIKLVVPLKTYKDELREKYSRPAPENRNTRMCSSLDKNEVCPYGDTCYFAHSLEELVIRDCHFKDNCRFVKIKSGKLVNDESNICRNKHTQESKEDFIKRTGLSHYKTSNVGTEDVKHEEINVDIEEDVKHDSCDLPTFAETPGFPHTKESGSFKFGSTVLPTAYGSASMKFTGANSLKFSGTNSFKFSEPLPVENSLEKEKEIVFRVPKVLAMQAFELAMNSGNKCIRVEIIE